MKSLEKDENTSGYTSNDNEMIFKNNDDIDNKTVIQDETIVIDYTWKDFDNKEWNLNFEIERDLYNDYRNESRKNKNDGVEYDLNYVKFVSDTRDDDILSEALEHIISEARKNYYSDYDIAGIFLSLVQSLDYTSDMLTRGYNEYPRYPLETLVDGGGDCEDTAALLVQMLSCADIDSVLIAYIDHMAVGIRCTPEGNRGYSNCYYVVGGSRYYYAETTEDDWFIGEMPEDYFDVEATVMMHSPDMAFMLYPDEA